MGPTQLLPRAASHFPGKSQEAESRQDARIRPALGHRALPRPGDIAVPGADKALTLPQVSAPPPLRADPVRIKDRKEKQLANGRI